MERHDTLLISSNSPENRAHLREALGEGFNLLESVNIRQALMLLQQNISCIAAMLLDITHMSQEDKLLAGSPENAALLRQVQIIVFTEDEDTERMNRAFALGASDVIPISYESYAMLRRIENIVQLHLHKQNLEELVERQAEVLRQTSNSVVEAMSSVIEHRSVESGQHILRIRHFTQILLEEVVRCCPEYNLSAREISIICSAAALHDIGKIAIPDSILMKPGKLTPEEWEIMKTHAATGCEILNTLTDVAEQEYLRYAHNICHYHHERWDGRGYPEGLRGDDIPICAQVVGLADVYDALTTKRVYKDAVPFAQATNMILKGECGAFSPKLLECFKHVVQRFEELAQEFADGLSPKAEHFDTTLPAPRAEQEDNSMERIRGKYYALVHYINGFLMELNMDAGLFHVVYNPYPDLGHFSDVRTFEDLERMLMEEVVQPGEKPRMKQLIYQDIQSFLNDGLRRQSFRFHFKSETDPAGELFEVTLLRINPVDTRRHTLAILARRVEHGAEEDSQPQTVGLADGMCSCHNDHGLTLLSCDSSFEKLTGYTAGEIGSEFGGSLIRLVYPQDRETVRTQLRDQLTRGTDVKLEFRLQGKDGRVLWVLCRGRLQTDGQGQECLFNAITDITCFRDASEELIGQLERYEIILAQTENVLFEWDLATDKINFSGTWEKIFGFTPNHEQFQSQLAGGAYLHPDDLPLLLDSIGNLESGSAYEMVEVRLATAKGRYVWCRIRATAIRDKTGAPEKVSGIIINIDAEKQAEQALQDRAERDALTRLLNKDAGRRQAEEYLERFPGGVHSAMLIIDLDNFKQVNDRYGHLFGDAVLTKTAREIKKMFRSQDIVSRIGGDEFMVLMRGISDRRLLEDRCRRLLERLRNVFQDQKQRLPLSCSIGIAQSPDHGRTYFELFNKADQALYWAKAEGKDNFVFYNEEDKAKYLRKGVISAVNNRIDSDEEPGLAEDNLVRYAFQRLYASADPRNSVHEILELVGQKMNVSRVYVFENSEDNRFCNNTFEWCNEGITPEIQNLQGISYEEDIAGYREMFDEKGIFYCPDINELPENIYNIVAPQGIKSLLHCAIRDGGVFRGYVGFDECVEYRYWTKEQIQTLTYFSEMLSVFLLKQRKQEKSMRYAAELQSILDNQNAWIYIIDPDTCQLKYINRKTKELVPEAAPGMYCYKTLMGQPQRCAGCPALNIRQCKNDRKRMHNRNFNLEVLADATLIQWGGEEACLLTCREIPREE